MRHERELVAPDAREAPAALDFMFSANHLNALEGLIGKTIDRYRTIIPEYYPRIR
jgi:hypothetical protein